MVPCSNIKKHVFIHELLNKHIFSYSYQLRGPTPVAMNIPNTQILVSNTILPSKEAGHLLNTGDLGQGRGMYKESLVQAGVPKSKGVLSTHVHDEETHEYMSQPKLAQ